MIIYLLFGSEEQSHSIWHEQLTVTKNSEIVGGGHTKIYADFSSYPSGYWEEAGPGGTEGIYAWVYFANSDGFMPYERYKIIEQREDYIIVEGQYPKLPPKGKYVYITRLRSNQANWSIVGEGSNKDTIICNIPYPSAPEIASSRPYDAIVLDDSNSGSWEVTTSGSQAFLTGYIN